MSKLQITLSQTRLNIQGSLFPSQTEESGVLTRKQQDLLTPPELLCIEEFIYSGRAFPGRPPEEKCNSDLAKTRGCSLSDQ